MANDLQLNTSTPMAGLGTFAYTVTTDGMYTCQCRSTIPCDPGSQANSTEDNISALAIAIKLDATTKASTGGSDANPTPSQGSLGCAASFKASAGQVISVVLSSSAGPDNLPNAVKSVINLFAGQ